MPTVTRLSLSASIESQIQQAMDHPSEFLETMDSFSRVISGKKKDNKTSYCRYVLLQGHCKFNKKCEFAHSLSELYAANIMKSAGYKTKPCSSSLQGRVCKYQDKCVFGHPGDLMRKVRMTFKENKGQLIFKNFYIYEIAGKKTDSRSTQTFKVSDLNTDDSREIGAESLRKPSSPIERRNGEDSNRSSKTLVSNSPFQWSAEVLFQPMGVKPLEDHFTCKLHQTFSVSALNAAEGSREIGAESLRKPSSPIERRDGEDSNRSSKTLVSNSPFQWSAETWFQPIGSR